MENKISVIVPIYNVEKFFRQCLDSVVGQTYRNLEIILVDDGSPDNCGAICDEYAAKDERIVVIHKENAGVSAARNDGIERATGEWVMFVDPDDWLELDCCEQVLEADGNKKNDIIYFQREMVDECGKCIIKYPTRGSFQLSVEEIREMRFASYIGQSEALGFQSIVPWAKVYRLKFLRDHSCRFPVGLKKSQDIVFNLYCQEYLKNASYLDYVGYYNRINSGSVCQRYNKEILDISLQFLKEMKKLVVKFHAGDSSYIKALGVKVYGALADSENLFFFYSQKEMAYKDYVQHMNIYYQDEIVSQYMNACKISDFFSYRQKIRYFFVSRHWLFPYYCLQRCWHAISHSGPNRMQLRYAHNVGRARQP